MLKYVVVAVGVFSVATVVSTAITTRGGLGPSDPDAGKSISDIVAEVAADQNQKRGQALNGMIHGGAKADGETLVLNFIIPNMPRSYNSSVVSKRVMTEMIATYCKGKIATFLKRGLAIEHHYKSVNGHAVTDGRLTAASCWAA